MSCPAEQTPRLILASTSRYRSELLGRLRLAFDVAAPQADESPLADELPRALVARLAAAKAQAVAKTSAGAWVIGSDQVASLDGAILGKPGTEAAARAQLAAMSGRQIEFLTAVSLMHSDGRRFDALDITTVRFRTLSSGEIARYVKAEQPLDCAGSFKSEGLGVALFDAIESQDPTALVGLPLIVTAKLLRAVGFLLP